MNKNQYFSMHKRRNPATITRPYRNKHTDRDKEKKKRSKAAGKKSTSNEVRSPPSCRNDKFSRRDKHASFRLELFTGACSSPNRRTRRAAYSHQAVARPNSVHDMWLRKPRGKRHREKKINGCAVTVSLTPLHLPVLCVLEPIKT